MTVQNQVITIEQALARGLPEWDVVIVSEDTHRFTIFPDLTQPPLIPPTLLDSLPSVYGLAIGPRSTIDRCWALWDPQVVVTIKANAIQPDFVRRLSVDAPLNFAQLGNRTHVDPVTVNPISPVSAIRVASWVDYFGAGLIFLSNSDDTDDVITPTTYTASAIGALEGIFTTILWAAPEVGTGRPQLHLVLYLSQASQPAPTKRFPYRLRNSIAAVITSPITTRYLRTWPVMGRKRIRVRFHATSTLVYNAVIGGLTTVQGAGHDTSIGTAAAVSATNPIDVVLDNPVIDYLNVYYTPVSGSGNVDVEVYAID